ncbi:sigma-70 family RNA polymerase sigma factor [Xylanibacillus composti]|uniref:RNA polymerase sigma factor n=1 Tax=Xylanibacillus composti TaxID=1572762 RepID=A0A8J4H6F1_9BACL|nr:sigma-70 family RNA polymerase sigma factor [Xylanibacillus composti]GIQ69348.1 hypothetical protein XYCOK13_21720 [Xylanibacillus composti]
MGAGDERELVARAARGDTEAYSALLNQYSNAVYAAASNIVRDHHLAQDLAQEAFVKAWFKLGSLQDQEKFGSWLLIIVRRICLDWLRRAKLVETTELPADLTDGENAETIMHRRDARHRVRQAINLLEESNRSVAILYFMNGYSAREIGGHLNLSVSAVESRIKRTKKKLKEELMDMAEQKAGNEKVEQTNQVIHDEVMWRITPRIATVEIPVSNLKRSIEWYTNTFGLSVWVELNNAALLHVQGKNATSAPGIYLVETESPERLTFKNSHTGVEHSVIDFYVPDLERFHVFCSDQKLTVSKINYIEGMGKQGGFGIKDPDGNSIGITNATLFGAKPEDYL